jgi:hypothetical protein
VRVEHDLQPAKSQDDDQGDLLSTHELQAPNSSHRQSSDHEICDHVRAAVGIAKFILVEAFSERPLLHVPECINRCAFESKGEKSYDAGSDTYSHHHVDWDSCFSHREDSSILCQDRQLNEGKADTVGQYAPV